MDFEESCPKCDCTNIGCKVILLENDEMRMYKYCNECKIKGPAIDCKDGYTGYYVVSMKWNEWSAAVKKEESGWK